MLILIIVLLFVVWLYVFNARPSDEEYHRTLMTWTIGSLFALGIILVGFAGDLGKLSAQHWQSTAPWYPQEAEAAANGFRGFGLLACTLGAKERIVLVIRDVGNKTTWTTETAGQVDAERETV